MIESTLLDYYEDYILDWLFGKFLTYCWSIIEIMMYTIAERLIIIDWYASKTSHVWHITEQNGHESWYELLAKEN